MDGWMENFPLHLVKTIAAGGPDIDPKGRKVAQAELERRAKGPQPVDRGDDDE